MFGTRESGAPSSAWRVWGGGLREGPPGREKVGKREVREESSRENKRTFEERKRHFKVYWRIFEKSAADHGWAGQPESKERGLLA